MGPLSFGWRIKRSDAVYGAPILRLADKALASCRRLAIALVSVSYSRHELDSRAEEATHLVNWKSANLSAFGQEGHSPLQHNKKSIGKANKRVNVYPCPDQPSWQSGKAQEP